MSRIQTYTAADHLQYRDNPEYATELQSSYELTAQKAPRSALAEALAAAFRSSDSGFGSLFADLFEHCDDEQRAKALILLIHSLTPASRQALWHAGLFDYSASGPEAIVDRMSGLCGEAVQLIGAEAARSDPTVIERVCDFYAEYPDISNYLPIPTLAVALAELTRRSGGDRK
jgi:hypothetical protein